jgi:hypothetical protein
VTWTMRYRYRRFRYRRSHGNAGMLAAGAAALVLFAAASPHIGHHTRAADEDAAAPVAESVSGNVALGRAMAAQYGWTGPEFTCLNWLWTRESGWQMVWNTQGSGAYGIPQALPASKMAAAGADYMTSPATQIRWGLGYIKRRYGRPCNAWDHELLDSWY